MAAPRRNGLQSNILHDADGRPIDVIFTGGVRRLAVDGTFTPAPPGTTIVTGALTAVAPAATVPLPVPAPGTLAMTVQNFSGAAVVIAIREVGGPAGAGIFLPNFGTRTFEAAIAPLEAEHISGPAGTVAIQFEAP